MGLTYRPVLAIGAWGDDPSLDAARLAIWLEALTCTNVEILRRYPEFPRVYASGVRYVSPEDQCGGCDDDDPWSDALECVRSGIADCEDLAAWLAAERRVRDGLRSRVVGKREYDPVGQRERIHCVVQTTLRNGKTQEEDPSRVLGLR